MNKTIRLVRKCVAAVFGFPLLAIGVILIPLPGPGLIVCFLALLILSLEFDWAKRYAEKAKAALGKIVSEARMRAEKAASPSDASRKK